MPARKKGGKRIVHETVIREVIERPVRKRTAKRKASRKRFVARKPVKRETLPKHDLKIERALIENFIGLQKVMVNLSVKFDELSNNISKLLNLFEISAKALAEKDLTMEKTERDDTKILKKMDNMFEQNRILARGLTLINVKLDEEPGYPNVQRPMQPTPQFPLNNPPSHPEKTTMPVEKTGMTGYQESILPPKQTFKKLPKQ